MQVSIESGEGLQRRMTVKLSTEQVDKEVDKRLKKLVRTTRMDGFRPGKVPLSLIKRRYLGSVRQEVLGEQVQASYFDAVRQESLKPAGEPKIEPLDTGQEESESGYGYTAVFEVLPEFELGELNSVTVKRPRVEVTDDDLGRMIEKLRKQRVTWSQVERPAVDGDQIKINFKGLLDGETFEGGSEDDVTVVLGSSSMIEGFEQGLVGAGAGDNLTLELRFPDNYPAERLAGKPVTFEISVTEVSEPLLPEVDEEFAKSFGVEEGGVERLYEDIRGNMERELEQTVKSTVKGKVMDALLEANKFDLPSVLVDSEVERMLELARQEAEKDPSAGNIEFPRESFEEQARRRVALGLIVSEIVEANEIKLDADRIRQTIETYAAEYEDPEEVINWYYGNREQLSKIESLVMEEQVVDWVVGQVNVEEEPNTFDGIRERGDGA